jgi:hypothetical protein
MRTATASIARTFALLKLAEADTRPAPAPWLELLLERVKVSCRRFNTAHFSALLLNFE